MFLDCFKIFGVKKTLKKTLRDVKEESLKTPVRKVAVIVDQAFFPQTAALRLEFVDRGIEEDKLKIVVFTKDPQNNFEGGELSFSYKNVNFIGKFSGASINEFLSEEFDLLVNYYEGDSPVLMLLTHRTKAKFKIGFSGVDSRLNHFFIKINSADYKGFVSEAFRYLKILNKL